MRSNGARTEGIGGIGLWLLVSLAVHALLLLVVPYSKPNRTFRIYPLANAGLIELGPSGGLAGGGPDNGKPGGMGGGGKAHFLNNAPKAGQKIVRDQAPPPPKEGVSSKVRGSGVVEAKGTDKAPDPGTSKAVTPAVVDKAPSKGPTDAPDVLTSGTGKGGAVTSGTQPVPKNDPAPTSGQPGGTPGGTGNSGAQGALSGQGGAGKGPGGPGGEGDSPVSGAGEGFVVRGAPPIYPKYAESNGIEGNVDLRIVVGKKGELDAVTVTESSGSPVLDNSCVKKIKEEWRFLPVGKGYVLNLTVSFRSGLVDYTMSPVKPL